MVQKALSRANTSRTRGHVGSQYSEWSLWLSPAGLYSSLGNQNATLQRVLNKSEMNSDTFVLSVLSEAEAK